SIFEEYLLDKDKFSSNYIEHILRNDYVIIEDKYLVKRDEANNFKTPFMYNELVVRNSKPTTDDQQLFYNNVLYCNESLLFDVYIKYLNDDFYDKISYTIKNMEYVSIGGQKSIGYNLFSYVSSDEVHFINNMSGKVLLSNTIGNNDLDYNNSYYKVDYITN